MTTPILSPATLPNLASAPSTPEQGEAYWDTTKKQIGVYNGTGWDYIAAPSGSYARTFEFMGA